VDFLLPLSIFIVGCEIIIVALIQTDNFQVYLCKYCRQGPDGILILLPLCFRELFPRDNAAMDFLLVIAVHSVNPSFSHPFFHPPLVFLLRKEFHLTFSKYKKRLPAADGQSDRAVDLVENLTDILGLPEI